MTKAAELAKMGEVLTNGQIGGRRNIVINGAMQVAQRSTSVTGIGASSGYFTLDRWYLEAGTTAGRLTMTQTADGPIGFANCMKLDCTTADTSIAAGELLVLQQHIEGQDVQAIGKGVTGAKQITLSFYVKANAAFTFNAEIQDQDNGRTNGKAFATTTDWVRHEITFEADADDGSSPFDDDNAKSLSVNFWLHGGSTYTGGTLASGWENTTNANRADGISSFYSSTDNNFFITGVQLEVGSVATPFEHRSYGEELQLCRRYFWAMVPVGEATGAAGDGGQYVMGSGYYLGTGQVELPLVFNQEMRAAPTLEVSSGTNHFVIEAAGGNDYFNTWAIFAAKKQSALLYGTSNVSGTAGQSGRVVASSTSSYVYWSAEL